MKKRLFAAALCALSAGAYAAPITEQEGNDDFATAQSLDFHFDKSFSGDIGDAAANTSQVIPHVTINAVAEPGGHDTFKFTVTMPNSRAIFDIDYGAMVDDEGNFVAGIDTNLSLFDALGNQLAFNDDSRVTDGQGGSVDTGDGFSFDSYIEYIFNTPGVYYIQVGSCCGNDGFSVFAGGGDTSGTSPYQLQVSLENALEVPEPAMLGLFGLGALALGLTRRRK